MNEYPEKIHQMYKSVLSNNIHQLSGRVSSIRNYGKLLFIDIVRASAHQYLTDSTSKLQLLISNKNCQDFITAKTINRGDIVVASGVVIRSNTGELSLRVETIYIDTRCQIEIPPALEDPKLCDSLRSLHYLVNPQALTPIIYKSKVISNLRKILENEGFLEVHTPILGNDTGANAAPFSCYYKYLKRYVNLRPAPELNLKMLVIGGLDRIYEIGPQFRNEDRDLTHNPEFFSCEFYWTHHSLEDTMVFTEQLLAELSTALPCINQDIDWVTRPYQRIYIVSALEEKLGQKLPLDEEGLKKIHHEKNIPLPTTLTVSKLLDNLISIYIEPLCINPTFLLYHPTIMSPLAKPLVDNPSLSDRFELFVKGRELCNSYVELNDPLVQKNNFMQQQADKAQGDKEVFETDGTFCRALQLGLPSTTGWGMGIERYIMLRLGLSNISDTIPFVLRNNDSVNLVERSK
jgi:lysyl-tRNA synthetase class 2